MKDSVNFKDYQRKVTAGYERMKSSRVVICSTVRDCNENLKKNLLVVNEIRQCFSESSVIIIENDSKDGTKDTIAEYLSQNDHSYAVMEDLGVITIPKTVESATARPWYSSHRLSLMAMYRNKYLDYIENNDINADYIIIIDLDVAYISVDGIANTFGLDIEWDGMAANGKNSKNLYYDSYGFKEFGDDQPQTEEKIKNYQYSLSNLDIGMLPVAVYSAFGGLGIYKASALKGFRYKLGLNDDPYVEAECDHVSFYKQMINENGSKFFINPSQIVFYNHYKGAYKQRFMEYLLRLFPQLKRVSTYKRKDA